MLIFTQEIVESSYLKSTDISNQYAGVDAISSTANQLCMQKVSSTTGQLTASTIQQPSTARIVHWVEQAYMALKGKEVISQN